MRKALIIIFLTIVCLFLYAKYVEPYNLNVNEYDIYSSKISSKQNGLKIVQFSDTLITDDLTMLTKVKDKINDLNADIIIFTGDLTKGNISDDIKNNIINTLNDMHANLYKYAISGDNDNDVTTQIYNNSNFIYLNNNYELLYYKDSNPIIINNNNETFFDGYENDYMIDLLHKPDDIKNIIHISDVVIAGHNNNGEIVIPFYGPVIRKDGSLSYISNYYEVNNMPLYISNGIKSEKTNLRLFNTPSINVYVLNHE